MSRAGAHVRPVPSPLPLGAAALVLAAVGVVATPAAAAPAAAAPAAAAAAPRPAGPAARAVTDPAQYVNAFVGTAPGGEDFGHGGGAGNTYPGAQAPFGMIQWSPDTVLHQHGGYTYADNRIRGFSLTHLSGPGCSDFGNIPFMPVTGSGPVASSTFSHANESASPGSYGVTFDNGIRSELTTTQRSGMARFTYPGSRGALAVDAAKAFNAASGSIIIGTNTLTGYTDGGGFCGAGNRYRIHFHVIFDRSFSSAGVVAADGRVDTSRRTVTGRGAGVGARSYKTARSQAGSGTRKAPTALRHVVDAKAAAQVFLSFDTSTNRTVTARVGISFTSENGARANLSTEQGTRSFDAVRNGTRAAWNEMLGRIAVSGGTTDHLRLLYTNLYHSLLYPSVFSDVDGRYMGFDNQAHTVRAGHTQYATFSGWDIYRSQVQLIALVAPGEAADIAQSAVDQARYGGYYDRWTVANDGTGVMVGDPLSVIVSSIHAFGATDFDARDGLDRMIAGSRDNRQRPAHTEYERYGYIPAGWGVWGATATTLEYYSADIAVAQLAGRLGDGATRDAFLRRANGWRKLFNPANGYIQPRHADGAWPPFSPTQENDYVEGNGIQYHWMIPFNYRGLFDAMGGNAASVSRLDAFFTQLNGGPHRPYAYLGNEPTLNTPWAYAYAGAPHRTQDVVRRALTTIFKTTPDGLVGNDDLGAMSSWAVWAAIGMYPEVPGRSELVLASPLFPEVTITRGPGGPQIRVTAPGASVANKYVQSLEVNGSASSRPWLSEEFVARGGTLAFTLGSSPNTSWGSAPEDAPPSFDDGAPPPRETGEIVGINGWCVDVYHSGTANGTAVQTWGCNGTGAQRWTVGGDGSLSALGKCLDVDHSGTADGTLVQVWECNGTGAQVWQARADGTLRNPNSAKCLDTSGGSSAEGARLVIWTCDGRASQVWRLPT
jgi:predicted alpha-1,2-mannosidase